MGHPMTGAISRGKRAGCRYLGTLRKSQKNKMRNVRDLAAGAGDKQRHMDSDSGPFSQKTPRRQRPSLALHTPGHLVARVAGWLEGV
jgi:hypothetical protein